MNVWFGTTLELELLEEPDSLALSEAMEWRCGGIVSVSVGIAPANEK